jgi:hypothetical protein
VHGEVGNFPVRCAICSVPTDRDLRRRDARAKRLDTLLSPPPRSDSQPADNRSAHNHRYGHSWYHCHLLWQADSGRPLLVTHYAACSDSGALSFFAARCSLALLFSSFATPISNGVTGKFPARAAVFFGGAGCVATQLAISVVLNSVSTGRLEPPSAAESADPFLCITGMDMAGLAP